MKNQIILILFLTVICRNLDAQSVQQLIEKGNASYAARSFDAAQQFYQQAISKDQDNQFPEAIFNLGNALFQQHQYDEAARQFDALTKSRVPPYIRAQAFYNLGNCYLQQKVYDASITAYEQALKINPHDEDARYNLSFAFAIVGRQSATSSEKNTNLQQQKQPKPLTNLTPEEMQRMLDELNNLESKTLEKKQKQRQKKTALNDW